MVNYEGCTCQHNPEDFERILSEAHLHIKECTELKSQWKGFAEEQTGKTSKKLLYAARLQRDPAFYLSKFGKEAYDIILGDCLWSVYQMIPKIDPAMYICLASSLRACRISSPFTPGSATVSLTDDEGAKPPWAAEADTRS